MRGTETEGAEDRTTSDESNDRNNELTRTSCHYNKWGTGGGKRVGAGKC